MAAEAGSSTGDRGGALRSVAHDLGNLAYRLTFLEKNLPDLIPDPARREETSELLADTADGMKRAAETLRSLATRD